MNQQSDFEFELTSCRHRSDSEPVYYLSKVSIIYDSGNKDVVSISTSSPISKESSLASVQEIQVWEKNGNIGVMTVQSPIRLKEISFQEISTQTDNM